MNTSATSPDAATLPNQTVDAQVSCSLKWSIDKYLQQDKVCKPFCYKHSIYVCMGYAKCCYLWFSTLFNLQYMHTLLNKHNAITPTCTLCFPKCILDSSSLGFCSVLSIRLRPPSEKTWCRVWENIFRGSCSSQAEVERNMSQWPLKVVLWLCKCGHIYIVCELQFLESTWYHGFRP